MGSSYICNGDFYTSNMTPLYYDGDLVIQRNVCSFILIYITGEHCVISRPHNVDGNFLLNFITG